MVTFLIIVALLLTHLLCIVYFFQFGYRAGYKTGGNKVLDDWKEFMDECEESGIVNRN